MQSSIPNLTCLPNEILEMIALNLEYAYEVNSLAQTCQQLYGIANHCLFKYYAKECSPHGIERVVMNNNRAALYKLLMNGLNFDEYFRITQRSTPIKLTVDKNLSEVAKLLVVYSEVFLQSDLNKYGSSYGGPGHRAYENDLENALYRAAYKGSLDVLRVLASSSAVHHWQKVFALAYAVSQGHLALAKYLIEEAKVDVNQQIARITRRSFFDSFLTQSTSQGNLEIVKLLVKAGADLDCPSFQRMANSPLCIAAARGHGAVVRFLIEKGMCFPNVKFHDIWDLLELSILPGYTISNIVTGTDLRTIMASPDVRGCGGYARGCFYDMAATRDDLPLYQEIRNLWGPSHHWQDLVGSFQIAIFHGSLTVARYIVDEMARSEKIAWQHKWSDLISYTLYYKNVAAFMILLDCGPPDDLPKASKGWVDDLLAKARNYPEHMDVLLQRGYLDETRDVRILKEMLAGAFQVGNLAFVWRLMKHGEFGPLDRLDDPDLEYHKQTVLQIAAYSSSLKIFREFLSAQNLTLDSKHPDHCAALASAAVGMNIDVIGYFLGLGFEINTLHETHTPKEDNAREMLIMQVVTARVNPDGYTDEKMQADVAATVEFLLDHGAQIDTRNSRGRTALSIALETRNHKLADMLFNRGANPLVAFESRNGLSAIEQLIRIFISEEYDLTYLNMLQASLEIMAARNYPSDDFLRLMPMIEGTLSRPRVISQLEDAPGVRGPKTLPYYEDGVCVRWSHFFLIKELRKRFWRAVYPVPSEVEGTEGQRT
ncbi:hypothetical protein BDW75DRAFT_225386 [Aspergillus navahoensis]